MSRRVFAGVAATLTAAVIPPPEPRHVVALGWISRNGRQATVSGRLTTSTNPAGR
jgi:hypothetical protein